MSPRGNILRYLHHPRKFREAGDELPIFEGILFSPRFAGERKVDRFGWILASTGVVSHCLGWLGRVVSHVVTPEVSPPIAEPAIAESAER